MAALVIVFLLGVAVGRKAHSWQGWDWLYTPIEMIKQLFLKIAQGYIWMFGIFIGLAVTIFGEMAAELILDQYRENRAYPLYNGSLVRMRV